MKNGIHVLVADDQHLFAECLKSMLLKYPDVVSRVDIATDGEDAIRQARKHPPDLVLMDVHMPGRNGLQTVRPIRDIRASTKVIMLTAFGYTDYVAEAIHEGAVGYILKDISPEGLIETVRGVAEGTAVFSLDTASQLLARMRHTGAQRRGQPEWMDTITSKEEQLLRLMVKGMSNDEIADAMNLGKQTVRNYISTLYSKLGVRTRFEAMREAITSGEFVPDPNIP